MFITASKNPQNEVTKMCLALILPYLGCPLANKHIGDVLSNLFTLNTWEVSRYK
jgi:hypothetical protein